MRLFFRYSFTLCVVTLMVSLSAIAVCGQTTSFTYQGRLTDSGLPANGNYDLQFTLWDNLTGGAQIGSAQTLNTISVVNGVFTVTLDFGAGSFPGANRFLEISTRVSGAGSFTLLAPRQPVTAIPYSIRSLNATSADSATTATTATTAANATQLGGVAASQYVQTSDARLSDARPPTAGSASYIQNTSGSQTANFNVSGNGTVGGTLSGNIVNAATQFNIGGNRVFSVSGNSNSPNANTMGGVGAGTSLTPNTNGDGTFNTFFGNLAGSQTTIGGENSFFGQSAGELNNKGNFNSFFGHNAGFFNSAGSNNTFIGEDADFDTNNPTGDNNTLLGAFTQVISGVSNSTAIGYRAQVTQSNSIVLGSISGVNNSTADTKVGIGTTAPNGGLEVKRNWDGSFGALTLTADRPTIRFSASDSNAANQQWILHLGSAAGTAPAGSLSFFNGGTAGTSYGTPVLSLTPTKTVMVTNLGSAGGTPLCRNSSNEISTCSSSLRYKADVSTFPGGMNIINHLRPISFTWKQDGKKDIGLGAEEVEKVEPLLTFRNQRGEIEGVKYNQLSAVFINAFKEQQQQINRQEQEIEQLQAEIRALRSSLHRHSKRR